MPATLHIVNGDTTADTLCQTPLLTESGAQMVHGVATSTPPAAMTSTVLPWRDILHDGPVPQGLSLRDLSQGRAAYLAQAGFGDEGDVLARFAARDEQLDQVEQYDEVVLWFEHDLYDQLQLLQLLDWFSRRDGDRGKRSLICIDRFEGVDPFYGLGQLDGAQLAGLYPTRKEITGAQLALGAAAWKAFTHPDPSALRKLMGADLTALPFLRAALIRLLEEYPDADDGLSRSERQILQLVDEGVDTPWPLFSAHQQREEAPFLGDGPFWQRIAELASGPTALLACTPAPFQRPLLAAEAEFKDQQLTLTPLGHEVLAGQINRVLRCGLDRWIGGVQLFKEPQ